MRSFASCAHPRKAASVIYRECPCHRVPLPLQRNTRVRADSNDSSHRVPDTQSSTQNNTTQPQPQVQGFQVAVLLVQQWTYNFVVSQSSSSLVAAVLMLDVTALDANQLAASAVLAQALQLSGTVFLLNQFCTAAQAPITQTIQYRWENGKPLILAAAAAITAIGVLYAWGLLIDSTADTDLAQAVLDSTTARFITPLTYVSILLAPVSEELLFRGIILGWLLRSWRGHVGTTLSVAASAISFSAFHASSEDFVPLTLFGLVVGSAYCASSSGLLSMHMSNSDSESSLSETNVLAPFNLVVPTLAHMMYNAFAAASNFLS